MFEISNNLEIDIQVLDKSNFYIIDNFYKDPDEVVKYFLQFIPPLWKEHETPSYNGIYFEDRRHEILHEDIQPVFQFLQNICKQQPLNNNQLTTNATKFINREFNQYETNYWWPHYDAGYTGILYLNFSDYSCGTNIYEFLGDPNEPSKGPEHYDPWKSREKYKLVKTLEPRYNRLVFFNAKKFLHGANICDDRYFFDEYRFNQVFFFSENNYV
jgi:hypothetical protein